MEENKPDRSRFIATKPAKEVYDDLIGRIKKNIDAKKRTVFDPETGIQKIFLDGKLIGIKQVRGVKKPDLDGT